MSPAEYIELFQNGGVNTGTHAMNFVTLLFAYLVAAYFAGAKMTTFQVIALTTIYSVFSAVPAGSAVATLERTIAIAQQFRKEHPEVAALYFDAEVNLNPTIIGGVFFVSWILSISYMISERRKSNATD